MNSDSSSATPSAMVGMTSSVPILVTVNLTQRWAWALIRIQSLLNDGCDVVMIRRNRSTGGLEIGSVNRFEVKPE